MKPLNLFTFALGVACGFIYGAIEGEETVRNKAIENNVAEYVLTDSKTGKMEFKWKVIK